ncbi:MAG TPA: ABC transporter permease [Vicinamibacterales bacterium]|jgi:lipopolysaccharide transport system permease protein|nr:ABC transporter permease [Vicinamibacterales bacterium]
MSIVSPTPGLRTRPVTRFEPPSLRNIRPLRELARLTQFFDLLKTLSIHRVKVRYKRSRLGILWALLHPLSMMLVFALMFSFIRGAPAQEVPYAVFAYAGLLLWSAFSSGLSSAATALTSHAALVTKVAFPREILPVTYVVAALTDLAIASTALVGMMFWFHVPLTILTLWSVVAVALLALFLVAAGLIVSAVQVRHRDVGLAMPVVLQMWMFATPVLYPLSAARRGLPAALYGLYIANPMAGIVDAFRRSVVLHQHPDSAALAVSALGILVLLPASYIYFKHAERTMADVV